MNIQRTDDQNKIFHWFGSEFQSLEFLLIDLPDSSQFLLLQLWFKKRRNILDNIQKKSHGGKVSTEHSVRIKFLL